MFEEKISGTEILILRGCRFCPAGSIVLRGPTEFLMDEIARSLIESRIFWTLIDSNLSYKSLK